MKRFGGSKLPGSEGASVEQLAQALLTAHDAGSRNQVQELTAQVAVACVSGWRAYWKR